MMGRFALTWGLSDIVRVGVVGGLLSCIDCALVGAALPSMRTDLGLSDGRLSLFVSLSVAGMMLASLGGRRVLQGLGRKGALRLAAVCVIAGVGLTAAFGGRFSLLAAGRVLQGFGLGLVFLTVPVVLVESVSAGFRGRAVCLYQLMMPVGMVVGGLLGGLLANVLSAGLAWRTSCLASAVPAVALATAGLLAGQGVVFAAAVAAFVMFYAVGPGVCVWLVTPEVMPVRFRPQGMCLATFGGHVSSLVLTAVFLPAVSAWGQGIVFLTLSGVAAAVCVLTATCLPETRGRSLV